MNETLTNFRQAVADNADLQEKVKAGADLVALGKENGYEFTLEELEAGWKELQESDEGLTDFELDVVSGGRNSGGGECACWVAREVYGETSPQWLLFRSWLLGDSPSWFRNLYISKGEAFADWLSKNTWLKPIIRRWMDGRIRS
jgi:predicted ribosomally synthesized peptide with nif11-like leader